MLPGATYGLRLWCVMEIFTFIQMGGKRERITVREIFEGARSCLATPPLRRTTPRGSTTSTRAASTPAATGCPTTAAERRR